MQSPVGEGGALARSQGCAEAKMASFVNSISVFPVPLRRPAAEYNSASLVTCSRQRPSTVDIPLAKAKESPSKRVRAKRRPESNFLRGKQRNLNLPAELLLELRRLLKGVQFAEEIAELANCRVAKFGGLIFAKQPISENCPDGLPQDMALLLQQNGDLEFIGIPPPLIERAAEIAKVSVPAVPLTSLCAVFEKYGVDRTDVDDGDFERRREEDIQLQMESWCDFGESLRTETDMLHPDGPDLFLESRVDLAE